MEDLENNDCHYIYKQVPHMELQASFTIYAMKNKENVIELQARYTI